MGAAKEKMMSIEARGYGESEKYVCSGCVRDPYLQKVIRAKGQVGTCSFCKNEKGKPIRHRKTYPLESLMAKIMPAPYQPALQELLYSLPVQIQTYGN